jgi:methionyl-tRNA formyltransferase
MKNLFCGDYIQVLESMHNTIGVQRAIIEKKNINNPVKQFCENHKIPYQIIESSDNIRTMTHPDKWDNVIIASFGVLLKHDFIEKCDAIYNFHPGNVINCRGRHPLPSAIKRGDRNIALSIHKITDEKIDRGPLVSQFHMALNYKDNYESNYKRLLQSLNFLSQDLFNMISSGIVPTWDWTPDNKSYLPSLTREELEKIIHADTLEKITV